MTRFDVILVPFPFSDLSTTKKRPALVVACIKPKHLAMHCIVAMITSNMEGLAFPHDVTLKEYKTAGLPKPSLVRVAKMVTIDSSIAIKSLGSLSKVDQLSVTKSISQLMNI
jgi:mRNA interferase MazF